MNEYTKGITLNFRPHSYFWAKEHGIPLISDIKGAERRKLYELALNAGLTDLVDLELLQHSLIENQRQAQGRIHPAFMGGEYLPDHRGREVEIARITIASTTQDVTCVYARPVGKRISYRVVDEYNGDTLEGPGHRTSLKPLTLEQLVDFFLESWNLISCLDCNFESVGHPPDAVHSFIVDASSSFYAEFGKLVHARVDEWLDTLPPSEEEDDECYSDIKEDEAEKSPAPWQPSALAIAILGSQDLEELRKLDDLIKQMQQEKTSLPAPTQSTKDQVESFLAALPKPTSYVPGMARMFYSWKLRDHVKLFIHIRGCQPDTNDIERLWKVR